MVENITPKHNAKANVNVTYYTLVSDYEGDYTKNCALLGTEIDGNFYFLRGNDIKSFDVTVDENGTKHLVLTRYNGEVLSGSTSSDDVTSGFVFEYDEEKGEIHITYPDGHTVVLAPFNKLQAATDSSILGSGEPENPLRLSELERTGTYAPARELLDLSDGSPLPDGSTLGKGYRVVTRERNSRFGLLYTYDEISKIDEALRETGSPWRVPTIEDWNSLLNSIECEGTPHDAKGEGEFGEDAGALLKDAGHETWHKVFVYKKGNAPENVDPRVLDKIPSAPEESSPEYISVKGVEYVKTLIVDCDGEDAYGFKALPVGYAGARANFLMDADNDIEGYGLCTNFWTSSPAGILMDNGNGSDAIYTKSFWYKSRKVIQQILSKSSRLSLRLVKDFTRNNFEEQEEILGSFYPCVHITADNGDASHNKIWTSINLSAGDFGGVQSEEWEEGAEYKTKFYICEWDGLRWRKKEMAIGDSVVIINGEDTEGNSVVNHEWRVFEGENGNDILVDTADSLKEEFSEEFNIIRNEISELSGNVINYADERVSELSGNVVNALEELSGNVMSYTDEKVSELSGNVMTYADERVSQLSGNVVNALEELSGNVMSYTDAKVSELSGNVVTYVEDVVSTEREERIANDVAEAEYVIGGGYEKAEIKNNSGNTVVTIIFDGNFGTI